MTLSTVEQPSKIWWKEAVVYQIYPRSFKDSNADGIGDIAGIISRLDYIADLGVDVIWLSPHFDSPNADNGYDIRDYRKVMSEFGTMADFDNLLREIKARGLRLIIDFVGNHTSDEHDWFEQSRRDQNDPMRDRYIWHPGIDGKEPNNWTSFFSGPTWTKDTGSGEYYLHLFSHKQPDLNWADDATRNAIYDDMRFWLDKGIDGFRLDVITMISKPLGLEDFGPQYDADPAQYYAKGPELHRYIQEMNQQVFSRYDIMTVGEAFGVPLTDTKLFVDDRRAELNLILNFDAVRIDRGETWRRKDWTLPDLKAVFTNMNDSIDAHCWNTVALSNHDNPRLVSHFGDDSPKWHDLSAKLLATLQLTLRGTPFVYQGDELGMTNFLFADIGDYRDVETLNAWDQDVVHGATPPAEFLDHNRHTARDHARTPMQWTDAPHGGFTDGPTPWIAANSNASHINAAAATADDASIYHFYRRLIALRRQMPALIYGDYTDLCPDHPTLFMYSRRLDDASVLVVLNVSSDPLPFALPRGFDQSVATFGNYSGDQCGDLRGWEARIYQ